jgi:metal-sulfur cluster biosynthetic enzyme
MTAALPDAAQVLDALRRVADPEVGIDIVEMGLIYGVDSDAAGIRVRMTLTSPACPTGTLMMEEAEAAVAGLVQAGTPVAVECVWEPPWEPERMSDAAKKKLGW